MDSFEEDQPSYAVDPIAEAVDQPALAFACDRWHLENPGTADYAASNSRLSNWANVYIQTQIRVDIASSISFSWKVSSERNHDFLVFDLDDTEMARISGEVGWQTKSFDVSEGAHLLRFYYAKDGSVSRGLDKGFVDKLVIKPLPGPAVAEAVDQPDLKFDCSRWHLENPGAADYAASDNGLSNWANAYAQTQIRVNRPSRISFSWKVSSELNYDFLVFDLDDTEMARISGEVGWQTRSFDVSAGSHLLRFYYMKDGSVASGQDKGFVDQLRLNGCPEGYLGDGDDLNGSGCTVYIQENYAGELFNDNAPDPFQRFLDWEAVGRYYESFAPDCDFAVFMPTASVLNKYVLFFL
jgi:hypothetical protein